MSEAVKPPTEQHTDRDDLARRVWRWYALASLATALVPGFTLGAGIFLARIDEGTTGPWQFAAGSAHGHAQIFGWAGLLVLGVAFHFLPRLAGTRLTHPRLAIVALAALCVGIFGRMIVQPIGAESSGDAARVALAGLALVELAGGVLALVLIAMSLSQSGSRATTGAMKQVIPFLILTAFGYVASLLLNLLRFLESGAIPLSGRAGELDQAVVLLGFYVFLLPISVGMSIRTFPLYIQGQPVRLLLLQLGLNLLLLGLAGRIVDLSGQIAGADVFLVIQGAGLALMIAGVRVFDRRRQLPRRLVQPLRDARQVAIISAYLWLTVIAIALVLAGLDLSDLARDLEFHLLGAGFITLLIFGVGSHLLPGFGRTEMRSEGIAWAVVALGNAAVVLRTAPHILDSGDLTNSGAAIAGSLGAIAVLLFACNVGIFGRQPRDRS